MNNALASLYSNWKRLSWTLNKVEIEIEIGYCLDGLGYQLQH